MNNPVVISGEASETDSEDELNTNQPKNMTQSVQGAVITGEDSESENENDASICSAVSALNLMNNSVEVNENKYDSLFHQKLRDYNVKLHNDIGSFCQTSIDDAGKNLNTIDQQLLKSQLTIQSAVTALKSLSANSVSLKNKLHSMLTAKFIPNVNVDNK